MQASLTSTAPSAPAPQAPRRTGAEAWDVLDDPPEWATFGREVEPAPRETPGENYPPGRWKSNVVVEGMHCAACALNLEAALKQVDGVLDAEVSAATLRASVVWDAARTQPSRWFAAAAKSGYSLIPASDAEARLQRRGIARTAFYRLLVAGFCMMQVMMYAYPAYITAPGEMSGDAVALMRWASWMLSLPVLLFSCAPFFSSAWRDLRARRVGMDLPVALGMLITFAVSSAATFDPAGPMGDEVYFDSFTMFVFFLLAGRWLEARMRDRTAGALEALINRLPDSVDRLAANGAFERVAARRLVVGDVVRVLPGEAFPGDGAIVSGSTSTDEALLTGESRPVVKARGESVLAGSHNLSEAVQVRIAALGDTTRFAQIVRLMTQASVEKPRLARLADRIARPFLVMVLLAAASALALWWSSDPGKAWMAAVAVLIVTCPCALSLATPAAMLASAGKLAREGVLTRRLQALESLATIDLVVLDKTGTLTEGALALDRVQCREGLLPGDVSELGAAIAAQSLHPVARGLAAGWAARNRHAPGYEVLQLTEHAGLGLEAHLIRKGESPACARTFRLGSAAFCEVQALAGDEAQVHLRGDEGWLASFAMVEQLRGDAKPAVEALAALGIEVRLLSGDRSRTVRRIADAIGIANAQGDCRPEDKLHRIAAWQATRRVAMVGDGLNDGPVLARADASFAFGQAAPLAQGSADFLVPGGALMAIPTTIAQARRTLAVVRQNLLWAAAYNATCVPLALAGLLPAWLAGLGMAASSLVVVANALRLSRDPVGAARRSTNQATLPQATAS
ncbi:Heavy metal translocating P-type ATPase [Burkholderiales bacterium 8X]|nr:Heavy metal translocating P-type ATPase [Burkholderiales bacterium 8X]